LISIFASGYVLIPPLPSFSWCLGWCPQEGVWAFWMSQWVDTPLLITTPRTRPPTPQQTRQHPRPPQRKTHPTGTGKGSFNHVDCYSVQAIL